ncbi:threonine dehydrogenase-like Zn-dependent dehydrogenase [Fictibacillus halophilus]|uniref:Threonine dehydrogenase-like Zn-dependent dehydrogenase n=1 Tax=Fictibacillus halophilus TaxID=1610490 RepID=A0ABV2LED2_9BACL|nr:zinc-binding alcohol dehydrogenase [Fictibacillus halophilus]
MKSVVALDGKVQIINETIPEIKDGYLLIKTHFSVISPGTELGMLALSIDSKRPLGYSAVGTVINCGNGTSPFSENEVVACYGAPYVKHAEYLLVPKTLCSSIPSSVDLKEGALAGLGAIAIHSLRVTNLQFGESVVVVGLGILGQLIGQIALAAGYQVFPYDISVKRAKLFQTITGITSYTTMDDLKEAIRVNTKGYGADAALLCAGGKDSMLTSESLKWIRDKGKVVIVGDIEPNFPRDLMFGKEAQILIARAGGPGRYDSVYEKSAIDYPYGFVRWTEGRNVEEFIRLLSEGRIKVTPYMNDVVPLTHAPAAYQQLKEKQTPILTKVIEFGNETLIERNETG